MIDPNRPMVPCNKLEPQPIAIEAIEGESKGDYTERIIETLRNQRIDPNIHVQADGDNLLIKVLPAGGPLLSTHWTCPTCGLTMRGQPARVCMDDCNPGCPIGGDL